MPCVSALQHRRMAQNQEARKHVVTVEEDSAADLQSLFDTVLKPDSKKPLQVPWSMRKLPDSFFKPPSTGSKSINHSRENSVDSAFGSSSSAATAVNSVPLPSVHHRAHSSPASLQQTYAVGQQQTTPHHIKQRSYDVGSKNEDNTPLPPGWDQARTPEGQVYYLNHITRTTTWEDPRKSLAAQTGQQHQSAEQLLASPPPPIPLQPQSPTNTPTKTPATEVELGSLPEGWEQAQTSEGEIYFINHHNRTTSWFDPRIPVHMQQRPSGSSLVGPAWHSSMSPQPTEQQQQLRLQQLQLERERLKQRQQEIRRQHEIMMRSSSDLPIIDPFLSNLTDHSRQESGDSGLSMGTTYSVPHTPEDFLTKMDDSMEVGSENLTVDTSDISALSENLDSTDDLMPTLQLEEEFSILDDVQSLINPPTTRPDNVLTWL